MASKLILYFVFLNAYEFKNWLLSYPAASVKLVKTTLHAHTVNNRKWPQKTNNRLSQSHRFSQRSFRVEQNPARSQKKKKNRLNSWVREKFVVDEVAARKTTNRREKKIDSNEKKKKEAKGLSTDQCLVAPRSLKPTILLSFSCVFLFPVVCWFIFGINWMDKAILK